MIREDLNIDYKDFLKQYVISPICDYTISFTYRGKIYQFDYVGVPQKNNGKTAYDFISYENKWDMLKSREHFKSLNDAIKNARFEGKQFEEIYNSDDSELIDIS